MNQTNHPLYNRSILVVGATGFIGTRLIEKLVSEHPARVTALVRNKSRASRIADLDVEIVEADLRSKRHIERCVLGHDYVINLAHDFKRSKRDNLLNFNNLIEVCAETNIKKFVHTSSIAVYDDWPEGDLDENSSCVHPQHDYAQTKLAQEKKLFQLNASGTLPSVIIQPTIVYGPHSWLWTDLIIEKLRTGIVILPSDVDGLCNAVFVDDVVEALILALTTKEAVGERFIISGKQTTTWHSFFESYEKLLGTKSIEYVDTSTWNDNTETQALTLKSLVSDPLQIANWGPVRVTLNGLRQLAGDKVLATIRNTVMRIRQKQGPISYYPNPSELTLYRAKGMCRIDKAQKILGYEPAFSLEKGMEVISPYIHSKFPDLPKHTN